MERWPKAFEGSSCAETTGFPSAAILVASSLYSLKAKNKNPFPVNPFFEWGRFFNCFCWRNSQVRYRSEEIHTLGIGGISVSSRWVNRLPNRKQAGMTLQEFCLYLSAAGQQKTCWMENALGSPWRLGRYRYSNSQSLPHFSWWNCKASSSPSWWIHGNFTVFKRNPESALT